MLQCQLPPSSSRPFDPTPNSSASSVSSAVEARDPPRSPLPLGNPGGDMGADRRLSDLVGSRFMESATSIFKVYIRDSLSAENSTNSNVAIDNKIEQAMDLVKSHLMFAVREEVEMLKEQIKDLLAKNLQLEYENSVLRADATPETLSKLQAKNIHS